MRPESVVTHRSGYVFAANWRDAGGISVITPDGRTLNHLSKSSDFVVRPNGIALEQGGSFLLAHLGQEDGGLFRLHPDGTLSTVLAEVDGIALPPSNFPLIDARGRIWLSVSTRISPRADDYRKNACSGFIVLIEGNCARIVADNLGYTNEMALSPDGRFLYVNETFGRRLTRFTIEENGDISDKSVVAEFGAGDYPDGLTLDVEGNFLVTSIVSNRVIRIDASGKREVLMQGSYQEHIDWAEAAYQSGSMGRPHLDQVKSDSLKNISSLALGGKDHQTAYLGCLLGENLATFAYEHKGIIPVHYDFDIAPLLTQLNLY